MTSAGGMPSSSFTPASCAISQARSASNASPAMNPKPSHMLATPPNPSTSNHEKNDTSRSRRPAPSTTFVPVESLEMSILRSFLSVWWSHRSHHAGAMREDTPRSGATPLPTDETRPTMLRRRQGLRKGPRAPFSGRRAWICPAAGLGSCRILLGEQAIVDGANHRTSGEGVAVAAHAQPRPGGHHPTPAPSGE